MITNRSMHTAAATALVAAGLLVLAPAGAEAGSVPQPAVVSASGPSGPASATTALAGAAVTVGQSTGYTMLVACTGPTPIASTVHASGGGASYTMPFAGVLTSFSTRSSATAGSVRALAFVDGVGNHKTLVGKSAWAPVALNANNTFAIRMPVPAGAKLGIAVDTSTMLCGLSAGLPGDQLAYGSPFNPDTSTDMSYGPVASFRPDISAVLEPDADGDTFGDVSQDLCPQSAATQAACPAPDTTVTKAPKKKSAKRQAKIKFTSSVPGSTFTCAVDGKAAKPCTSPFKKKYKYGKHKVVITAISALGIVDATPVTVKFKVKKPRR